MTRYVSIVHIVHQHRVAPTTLLTTGRASDWVRAQQRAGLQGAAARDSPVAMVIYGPAGVGKSTVRRMLEEGDGFR